LIVLTQQLVLMSISISRQKLKRGNYTPDHEKIIKVINPCMTTKEFDEYLMPAARFLADLVNFIQKGSDYPDNPK